MSDLKDILRESGVTHQAVADRCGQHRSYVTRQLTGIRPMTAECAAAADAILCELRAKQAAIIRDLLRRSGQEEAANVVDRYVVAQ